MKKIKIIKSILSSTLYIRVVIFVQVFLMLLFSISYINRYYDYRKKMKYLESTPFKKSIFFMGHVSYEISRDDNKINNSKFIYSTREKIKKYVENNKKIFKGMYPLDDRYTLKLDDDYYTLMTYDINTINTVNPEILKNNSFNSEDYIEILVSRNLKNKYPVGSLIKLDTKEKEVELKVVGYHDKNLYIPNLGIVANSSIPLIHIFDEVDEQPDLFITDDDNINLSYISEYNSKIYDGLILYLNENITKNDLINFENYIKENKLGYFQYSEDIFEKQNEGINFLIQRYFDIILSFIVILIMFLISLGHINKDRLEDRFKSYYYSGANLRDIFSVSFIYYFVLLFVPIVFYNIFITLINIDFLSQNVFSKIKFIHKITLDDRLLHTREFIVLSLVLIIIISIISYWQVINIKNKYAVDRR